MSQYEIAKSLPSRGQIHVNRPLTEYSEAYIQSEDSFVASRAYPIIQVKKQIDQYFKYDRSHWNRRSMKHRAPGAMPEIGGYGMSTGEYNCKVWALGVYVTDEDKANADSPLKLEQDAVDYLMGQGLLNKEIIFATDHFATGKWTTEVTPSVLWSDPLSDPFKDVSDQKRVVRQLTGKEPNRLTVDRFVYDALKLHPDIVARISGMSNAANPAMVNRGTLAALFEVGEVLVMEGIETTSAEGAATDTSAFIAGKHALLSHVPPRAGLKTVSGGFTITWAGKDGENAFSGQNIKRLYEPAREATLIWTTMAFDMKQTAPDVGAFFLGAVA